MLCVCLARIIGLCRLIGLIEIDREIVDSKVAIGDVEKSKELKETLFIATLL